MSGSKPDNVKQAMDILSGTHADFETLCGLAKELKKERAFRDARKILFLARNRPEAKKDRLVALKLAQDHALATYKDPDLPAEEKLDRAFEILQEGDDLRITVNQETLGLAGAIFKRRWELNGLKQNLEHSLAYYLRGHEQGVEKDNGYTGINAALMQRKKRYFARLSV